MWWGMMNPTAASQAEMTKMVVEKQMAFVEDLRGGADRDVQDDAGALERAVADRLMQAALAPSARRVKANVRRLRG